MESTIVPERSPAKKEITMMRRNRGSLIRRARQSRMANATWVAPKYWAITYRRLPPLIPYRAKVGFGIKINVIARIAENRRFS